MDIMICLVEFYEGSVANLLAEMGIMGLGDWMITSLERICTY